MTRDTMENRPYTGSKKGATGTVNPSPLIAKVGKTQKVTITGRN